MPGGPCDVPQPYLGGSASERYLTGTPQDMRVRGIAQRGEQGREDPHNAGRVGLRKCSWNRDGEQGDLWWSASTEINGGDEPAPWILALDDVGLEDHDFPRAGQAGGQYRREAVLILNRERGTQRPCPLATTQHADVRGRGTEDEDPVRGPHDEPFVCPLPASDAGG